MQFRENHVGLPGLRHLSLLSFHDTRGSFTKLFHSGIFEQHSLDFQVREIFLSESAKGVVRGMHFQTPPHDHTKVVMCLRGRVHDVVLDIRRGSPTIGQALGLDLDAAEPALLVIPPGFAHGFAALTDNAQMLYLTSSGHAPDHDVGILWNSFAFQWPEGVGTEHGDISERDRRHSAFEQYDSPFVFGKTAS